MHWILTVSNTFTLDNIITRSRQMLCPPFRVSGNNQYLRRVERLSTAHTIDITITQTATGLVLHTDTRL